MAKKEQIRSAKEKLVEAQKELVSAVEAYVKEKGSVRFPPTSMEIGEICKVEERSGVVYACDYYGEIFGINDLGASDMVTLADIINFMG